MSNVRGYRTEELLERVRSLQSFKGFPTNYWIIGVQSQEDETNIFDDKFYLFKGEEFQQVYSGTTNAGIDALTGYDKVGLNGAAVWKTNIIYYDLYSPGKHKGKMDALRQVKSIYYYRDKDKDGKNEEGGELQHGIIGCNLHTNSYDTTSLAVKKLIGGWSYGCQVLNEPEKYRKLMLTLKDQKFITYCLLKEF